MAKRKRKYLCKLKNISKVNKYDTIRFTENFYDIVNFVATEIEKESIKNMYIPLNEGVYIVMVEEDKGLGYYFYYNIDGTLEVYVFESARMFLGYCFSVKMTDIFKSKFKILDSAMLSLPSITQKVKIFFNLILYLSYIKDNQKTILKSSKKKKAENMNNTNNKRSGTEEIELIRKSVSVIQQNKVLYIANIGEDNYKTFKRTYRRHKDSWNVMGHVRHYKSGKTVYIKPHVCGKGEISKKDYIVK